MRGRSEELSNGESLYMVILVNGKYTAIQVEPGIGGDCETSMVVNAANAQLAIQRMKVIAEMMAGSFGKDG